ncbi:hypothetical protein BC826DRAFT_995082 [Russula brevipes]|nr:hypothetical protein BC826DRAFT_995082 [Russula brevipes]
MSEVRNPGPSLDQLDDLIELLATDDAGDDSNFHIAPEGTASTGLRDADGKLDYAKIRSLFLQRRANNANADDSHISHSDPFHIEPDAAIKLPQIVIQEPTAVIEGSFSPEPSPRQRESESREIEAVPEDNDIPYSQSVLPPEASTDSIIHHLQDALTKANEEVAQLHREVLQLQTQITKLFKSNSSQEAGDVSDTRGYLANTTKLAASTLDNVQETSAIGTTVTTHVDRSDMERAIQFLIRTDELVWRRSRYPNGPPGPVFSQRNIDAITERLALWENIVRSPGP